MLGAPTAAVPTTIVRLKSICTLIFAKKWGGVGSYPFVRAPFAQTLTEVDRGRPSGHARRGWGSILAACRAWRALKVLFSAGVDDKTISRGFLLEALLCIRHPPFFEMLVFSVHTNSL